MIQHFADYGDLRAVYDGKQKAFGPNTIIPEVLFTQHQRPKQTDGEMELYSWKSSASDPLTREVIDDSLACSTFLWGFTNQMIAYASISEAMKSSHISKQRPNCGIYYSGLFADKVALPVQTEEGLPRLIAYFEESLGSVSGRTIL